MAGGILLLAACAAPQQPQVLALFFDGVTPETRPVAASAAPVNEETSARVAELYLAARSAPAGVRHKPYAERECLSCHESQFSQKLRGEIPALCVSCHPGVAAPRDRPATFAGHGNCLACHHPHEGPAAALLVGAGWKLCGGCHEEKLIAATPTHAQAADRACQDCHDPHAANDPHLPRKPPTKRSATPAAPRTSV